MYFYKNKMRYLFIYFLLKALHYKNKKTKTVLDTLGFASFHDLSEVRWL